MAELVPYINFADQGREAIEFYKSIFGGKADVQLVKDSPNADQMPKDWADRIFHFSFQSDAVHFLGSDIISDQAGKVVGNVYSLALMCDSSEQLHEYMNKLAEDGKVVWPAGESEWGSIFGQVVDKFGLTWMLNYDKN